VVTNAACSVARAAASATQAGARERAWTMATLLLADDRGRAAGTLSSIDSGFLVAAGKGQPDAALGLQLADQPPALGGHQRPRAGPRQRLGNVDGRALGPARLEIGDDLEHGAADGRPTVAWLGGFKSDMLATKASFLDQWARENGRAFLRFDYSGHGESEGLFEHGTIGRWLAESLAVIRAVAPGPLVLVGSSMGGWIALLAARALAQAGEAGRLKGMVLIAPAVDFTETLMWANLPETARRDIMDKGAWLRPSDYSPEPYPITRALIEEGRDHLLFDRPLRSHCPVHILQGMRDPDVPWRHALTLVEHLAEDSVVLTLVKDGDHRLSGADDLARLAAAVENLA
jgi:pimeloyl-ACP methyl ester carboxylesterase